MGEFRRIVRAGEFMVLTQRSDLLAERDFRSTLAQLAADGLLAGSRISDPMPYLPDNPEFSDEVQVHYIHCTVVQPACLPDSRPQQTGPQGRSRGGRRERREGAGIP